MELHDKQQDSQKVKASVAALRGCKTRPEISHEWEEFLYRLSAIDDPKLREFACLEMAKIRSTSQGMSFFDMGEKSSLKC